jgi:hypothetical protein
MEYSSILRLKYPVIMLDILKVGSLSVVVASVVGASAMVVVALVGLGVVKIRGGGGGKGDGGENDRSSERFVVLERLRRVVMTVVP